MAIWIRFHALPLGSIRHSARMQRMMPRFELRTLPQLVKLVAASCFSFGFNRGIIAGALLFLVEDFPDLRKDPVLKGALTASVFAGAFVSNTVTGPLADRFGRVPAGRAQRA